MERSQRRTTGALRIDANLVVHVALILSVDREPISLSKPSVRSLRRKSPQRYFYKQFQRIVRPTVGLVPKKARTTVFQAGIVTRGFASKSPSLASLCRISRNRCKLDNITTPGLRWIAGGRFALVVRLSASSRMAIWP